MDRAGNTKWLKGMYLYTAAGAGLFGVAMLAAPGRVVVVFRMPEQDPIFFGLVASAYVAFGLVSLLGLRSPLRFAPILLLQLLYKSVWMVGVFIPLTLRGQISAYRLLLAVVFASYIVGDLIAIPFRDLLSTESRAGEL